MAPVGNPLIDANIVTQYPIILGIDGPVQIGQILLHRTTAQKLLPFLLGQLDGFGWAYLCGGSRLGWEILGQQVNIVGYHLDVAWRARHRKVRRAGGRAGGRNRWRWGWS